MFVPACTAGPPGLPFCGTDAVFTEGRKAFDWFRRLTPAGGTQARLPARLTLTSPATAVYSDPVTLDIQLTSLDLDQALPIEAPRSSLRVVKESTSVRWFDDVGPSGRHHRVLAAQLRDNDGHPVRKRTVVFTVASKAGTEKCSGVTDAGGIARCKVSTRAIGGETVSMFFAGDAYYESADGIAHQRDDLERHRACHSADAQRLALNLRRESRQDLLHHRAHQLAISRTRRDVAR